jgi:hypothetical protein
MLEELTGVRVTPDRHGRAQAPTTTEVITRPTTAVITIHRVAGERLRPVGRTGRAADESRRGESV